MSRTRSDCVHSKTACTCIATWMLMGIPPSWTWLVMSEKSRWRRNHGLGCQYRWLRSERATRAGIIDQARFTLTKREIELIAEGHRLGLGNDERTWHGRLGA